MPSRAQLKKGKDLRLSKGLFSEMRQRPTLPYSVPYSTIGSMWLNFRVRNENGWVPHDIITAMVCLRILSALTSFLDNYIES